MMAKKIIPVLLVIGLFFIGMDGSAFAVDRQFGLGGVLGEPFGVSMKYMFTSEHSLDWDIGFTSFHGNFMATIDYLYHFRDLLTSSNRAMIRPYIGGGLAMWFREHHHPHDDDKDHTDLWMGPRFTGGFSFYFPKPHVEAFIDLSPGFTVVEDTGFFLNGVVGCRYFF